jgi:hypothetical protein
MTRTNDRHSGFEKLAASRRQATTPQHPIALLQLAPSQREQIHAMILGELPDDVMAETVERSEPAIRRIRSCQAVPGIQSALLTESQGP